nr:hypothetical protein [Saprospiraceae bacterium]
MKPDRLIFVFLLFLMLPTVPLNSQDTIIVDMIKSTYDVPLKIPKGTMILSTWVAQDTSEYTFKKEESSIEVQRYMVDLEQMIYLPQYKNDSFNLYNAEVFTKGNNQQLFFYVDVNRSQKRIDNKVVPIKEGVPFYYEIPLWSLTLDSISLLIPFQFKFTSKGDLWATSLLKYKIPANLKDSSMSIDLNFGVYFPNFAFPTFSEKREKITIQNYLLEEPFFFNGTFWKLTSPNLDNNKITFVELAIDEKPIGYKAGYYVNFEELFEKHDKPIEVIQRSDSSIFLFYFWGKWCQPCLKAMPSTNELGRVAKASDILTMYGVALLSSTEQPSDIVKFVQDEGIVFPNFFESLTYKQNSIRSHLKIMSYPTYILVNSQGQILLRSGSAAAVKEFIESY